MPYIKKSKRDNLYPHVENLISALKQNAFNEGEVNYVISRIVKAAFDSNPCYSEINKLMGAMESAKLEFYRRMAVPYEEEKIKENGDI